MVRSVRHAQAAEAALRARVAKAMAQIEALNQRGRGKKRFETCRPYVRRWWPLCSAMAWRTFMVSLEPTRHAASGASLPGAAGRVDEDRHATVEVCVDEAALEAAVRRLGWRVYGTQSTG